MDSAIAKAYNNHFEPLDDAMYIELQWNRKWKECGQFSLYLAASDWDKNIKYITIDGRPETGIVQKTEFVQKTEGDFVTLSGFFIHRLLNWKTLATYAKITNATGLWNYINNCSKPTVVTPSGGQNAYKCFYNVTDPDGIATTLDSGAISETIEPGVGLCDGIFQVLENYPGYSFYTNPLMNPGFAAGEPWLGHAIKLLHGFDKTDSVEFKKSNNNASEISYVLDDSAECGLIRTYIDSENSMSGWGNEYYTGVGDNGANRMIKHYAYGTNTPAGMGTVYPECLFGGSTDLDVISGNKTAILNQLTDQGKLEILNHYKEETLTVAAIQIPGCEYLTDYNLGDTVSCTIDEIETTFAERITEVSEVHAANHCEVQLTLGEPSKKMWRKI